MSVQIQNAISSGHNGLPVASQVSSNISIPK